LQRDLRDVKIVKSAKNCKVQSGILSDPFSGEVVHFDRGDPQEVQIDHVFPLAVAWERGASAWELDVRRTFANDPRNLLAVSKATNQAKGAKMPTNWVPETMSGKCVYARTVIDVARKYQLILTWAEVMVLRELEDSNCG
jgi:hypothetical protein